MSQVDSGIFEDQTSFDSRYPEFFRNYVRDPEPIGSGSFGIVFRAHDLETHRRVAVKFLQHHRAGSLDLRARFAAEVSYLDQIDHRHCVKIVASGEQDGIPFIVMEFIDGKSAHAVCAGGRLPVIQAARLACEVASALSHAHTRKRPIIHRDVKPSNILVENHTGRTVLTDFGIAKRLLAQDVHTRMTAPLTGLGISVGTLAYMPPEYLRSEVAETSEAGDIYSLGVTLYELLSGRTPFPAGQGLNEFSVIPDILAGATTDLRKLRPEVPDGLAAICARAMKREANARYTRAEDMADALQCFIDKQTALADKRRRGLSIAPRRLGVRKVISARPWKWAIATAAVVLLLVAWRVLSHAHRFRAEHAMGTPPAFDTSGNPVLAAAVATTQTTPSTQADSGQLESSEEDAAIRAAILDKEGNDSDSVESTTQKTNACLAIIDRWIKSPNSKNAADWKELQRRSVDRLAVNNLTSGHMDEAEKQFKRLLEIASEPCAWRATAFNGLGDIASTRFQDANGASREQIRQLALDYYKQAKLMYLDPSIGQKENADAVERKITSLQKAGQ